MYTYHHAHINVTIRNYLETNLKYLWKSMQYGNTRRICTLKLQSYDKMLH